MIFELSPEQVDQLVEKVAERVLAHMTVERGKPFTLAEAAEELAVSTSTVRRMIEAGQLGRVDGTGKVLIPVADVRAVQRGEVV